MFIQWNDCARRPIMNLLGKISGGTRRIVLLRQVLRARNANTRRTMPHNVVPHGVAARPQIPRSISWLEAEAKLTFRNDLAPILETSFAHAHASRVRPDAGLVEIVLIGGRRHILGGFVFFGGAEHDASDSQAFGAYCCVNVIIGTRANNLLGSRAIFKEFLLLGISKLYRLRFTNQ